MHRDFATAIARIRESAELCIVNSPEEFLGRLRNSGDKYDLALSFTSRPGELPDDLGRRLIRAAPLVGRAVLLGTWCEGDERNGRPWAAVERVFWHRFAPWWETNLRRFKDRQLCSWHTGYRHSPLAPSARPAIASGGVVVVRSTDWQSIETIMALLDQAGYATVASKTGRPIPIARPIAAGIWIGGQMVGDARGEFTQFANGVRQFGGASLVAAVDFPRVDDAEFVESLAGSILAKPWRKSDLLFAIEQPGRAIHSLTTSSCA